MMRSNINNNDDDDFGPNPFRSSSDATADDFFFDAPAPPPSVSNYSNQQFNNQQPLPVQQQQYNNNQQQPQQQQFYDSHHQPGPNGGMMGNFPAQQPPLPYPAQQQYLTGTMDNRNASVGQVGASNNEPVSIFSVRGIMNACFKVDHLIALFNVDAVDIYLRLKGSVLQFHQPDQFRTSVIGDGQVQDPVNPAAPGGPVMSDRKGPDLYGPFWISMTLIFILGMTSNLSDYMHHKRKADPDSEFEYDITHLLRATTIVLGFSFGVPTFFWLACQCLGMPGILWSMWICCYGYSMTAIAAGALTSWILPFGLWHWLTLAAAVGASGLLVVRNLSTPLLSQDDASHAKAAPLLLAMLGAHFTYLIVLKLTFYP
jgi:protein YIPF1/2